MALSINEQLIAAKGRKLSATPILVLGTFMSTLVLSACQTAPYSTPPHTSTATTTHLPAANEVEQAADYPIEPYIPPAETANAPVYQRYPGSQGFPSTEQPSTSTNPLTQQTPIIQPSPTIQPPIVIPNEPLPTPSRDDYIISQPPATPSHSDLLERARQNSQQQSRNTTSSQSDLPAFRSLMQTGTNQLKAGNLTAAENSFTRAQRLAPRSSAVYFYLSQVALKKNQPRKAEAMARRGLTVSEDANRRRALWQLILVSGQQQNNARVVREAQQALR